MSNDKLRDAAHDAISRALDEASVRPEVLRGMCLEAGLEAFESALATPTQSAHISWDEQGRRTVNGALAPEHEPASTVERDAP